MSRSLRYKFSGGVYHIVSRGNYRKAFEKALYEASERCGWVLHAYVIMSNHYHLALEAPEPNLVDGMKWPKRESWCGSDIQAMKEAEWEDVLKVQLKKRRKHAADRFKDAKSAKWKVDIARHLRKTTTASNSWIAEKLNMGHPSRFSNLIHGN